MLPLSCNLQIGVYIDFKKTFQTYYTTILSLIWLFIHIMCAYNIAWASGWVHGFCSFGHSIFPFSLRFVSSMLCTRLSLPHPSTFRLINCICGQPLNLARTTFFIAPMVRRILHLTMLFKMFSSPSQ